MNVGYLPAALAEYEAAARWHDDQSPGMGDEFVQAIERAESLISDTPFTWPQWPGARAGIRRYLIPGLLYAIAYEIVRDEVLVLAVAHQRRRPDYWLDRAMSDYE